LHELAQDHVAVMMAVLVVRAFEVIDIEYGEMDAASAAPEAFENRAKIRFEKPSVPGPGKGILVRQKMHFAVRSFQAKSHFDVIAPHGDIARDDRDSGKRGRKHQELQRP
jgi:hypothetical protein